MALPPLLKPLPQTSTTSISHGLAWGRKTLWKFDLLGGASYDPEAPHGIRLTGPGKETTSLVSFPPLLLLPIKITYA